MDRKEDRRGHESGPDFTNMIVNWSLLSEILSKMVN